MKSTIAALRKSKGITQETLAEQSGVTVRTIQRIENGKVVPHHQTLKLIADALQVQPDELYQQSTAVILSQNPLEAKLIPLFHALPLFGVVVPFANVILPVVLWLVYRTDATIYDREGRKVINFHITLTLLACISLPLLVFYMPVGYPLFILCYVWGICFAILNTVKAAQKTTTNYPLSIPFLRRPANVG